MDYRGAVFFDYDGTLTDEKAGVMRPTEATKRAVAAFQKKGYLAILSSGRAKCYADDSGVPFDGMVTSNGTYVEVNGQVIFDHPIETGVLSRLIERMNEMDIQYGLDHPVKCYARDLNAPVFLDWLKTYGIRRDIFRPVEPGVSPVGYKFSVLFDSYDQIDRLRDEFKDELVFECQRTFKCADVTTLGFNKAAGVRAVAEHFHLPLENTYAFGDGMNDVAMFQSVGHGIAMGDHAKELEACCEFVTKRVCEEGIEYGLRHYGLI